MYSTKTCRQTVRLVHWNPRRCSVLNPYSFCPLVQIASTDEDCSRAEQVHARESSRGHLQHPAGRATKATNNNSRLAGNGHEGSLLHPTCCFCSGRWKLLKHEHTGTQASKFHRFPHSRGAREKAHSQIEIQYLQ